jgi:hypothetical protein
MPHTQPARRQWWRMSPRTSSVLPPTQSRRRVRRAPDARSAPAGLSAAGSANSSRMRSANSSLTISGCETTSAGRCSTADGREGLPTPPNNTTHRAGAVQTLARADRRRCVRSGATDRSRGEQDAESARPLAMSNHLAARPNRRSYVSGREGGSRYVRSKEKNTKMPELLSTSSLRSTVTRPLTAGRAGGGWKDPSTSRGWERRPRRTTPC